MSPDLLRRKILEEWRGLDDPPSKPDRCLSINDVLGKILPKLGLSERLSEQQITEAWSSIVGGFLAQHSLPVALQGGILSIQVLQPTVRYELERSWKAEILSKLQARFTARVVREIRFRL